MSFKKLQVIEPTSIGNPEQGHIYLGRGTSGIWEKYENGDISYWTTGATMGAGTSGSSGKDGERGQDGNYYGTSGTSGIEGTSGTSGISSSSGRSGTSGVSGTSGSTGTSGASGTAGSSGTSGLTGSSGSSGISTNGTSGSSGKTGTSGTSGVGSSGTSGQNGAYGGASRLWTYSNTINTKKFTSDSTSFSTLNHFDIHVVDYDDQLVPQWLNTWTGGLLKIEKWNEPKFFALYENCISTPNVGGVSTFRISDFIHLDSNGSLVSGEVYVISFIKSTGGGTSGSSGKDGSFLGSSGTSGITGTSGTSGTGVSGTSGTSGEDGGTGTSGTSGITGTSGTSGGTGTSGVSGTSGINGLNGTSGISGTSGVSPAGASIWTNWTGATRTSDSTITGPTYPNVSVKAGTPVRYRSTNGSWRYAIVISISGNVHTIAGYSCTTSDDDEFQYGILPLVQNVQLHVSGDFADGNVTASLHSNGLLYTDLNMYNHLRWKGPNAFIVHIEACCFDDDTVSAPTLQLVNSNGGAFANVYNALSVNKSGIATTIDTDTDYQVLYNNYLDFSVVSGGAGNAKDIDIYITLVADNLF